LGIKSNHHKTQETKMDCNEKLQFFLWKTFSGLLAVMDSVFPLFSVNALGR